jgi:hypothetical protein
MTLDEMLKLAAHIQEESPYGSYPFRLGNGVLALFGESQPCGWPEPVTKGPRSLWWEPLGMLLTSDEARAIAVMLLRAADEAEAKLP